MPALPLTLLLFWLGYKLCSNMPVHLVPGTVAANRCFSLSCNRHFFPPRLTFGLQGDIKSNAISQKHHINQDAVFHLWQP